MFISVSLENYLHILIFCFLKHAVDETLLCTNTEMGSWQCANIYLVLHLSMYSTIIVICLLKKIVLWHVHQVTQLENGNVSQRIKDLKVPDKSFKTQNCAFLKGKK